MGRKGRVFRAKTFDYSEYTPCQYFKTIYTSRKNLNVKNDAFMEIPLELGAFEVYFMDVLIFSKLLTHQWPNIIHVAQKCISAYNSYYKGEDIKDYELGRIPEEEPKDKTKTPIVLSAVR